MSNHRTHLPTDSLTETEATAIVNEAIDLDGQSEAPLTVADLEDRVEALGVPRSRVQEVLLSRARKDKEAEGRVRASAALWAERRAAAGRYVRRGVGLSAVVWGLFVMVEVLAAVTMGDNLTRVGAAQEKVYAAMGRQQTTLLLVQGFTHRDRDAEVESAAYNVNLAKNQYDVIVTEYNSFASGFLGRNLVRVFPRSFPARRPLARDIWR